MLHELAKFGAGLVAGDFLALLWIATHNGLPLDFLGFHFTQNAVVPGLIFDAALFMALVHYGWHVGKIPRPRERMYLIIAGSVFGVVAAAHIVRLFTGFDVTIAGWGVPLWLSWVGTLAAGVLSYASIRLALRIR